MSRRLSTRNVSSRSMHAFLSNLVHRQTDRQIDRQADRQTNEHGQKHIPPPLSEVKLQNNKPFINGVNKPNALQWQ